jgi:hypothetical protein
MNGLRGAHRHTGPERRRLVRIELGPDQRFDERRLPGAALAHQAQLRPHQRRRSLGHRVVQHLLQRRRLRLACRPNGRWAAAQTNLNHFFWGGGL